MKIDEKTVPVAIGMSNTFEHGRCWEVLVGLCDVATYTTRSEAERHAARIRRALKGGE